MTKVNRTGWCLMEIWLMSKASAIPGSDLRQVLALSLALGILIIASSGIGLMYPDIYNFATPNWLAQTVGQDTFDLFVLAPLLVVSGLYAYVRNRLAWMIWGGTVAYTVYTFLIYCFCVTFNPLFGLYCAILGLSLFSLIWFIYSSKPGNLQVRNQAFVKVTAYYFLFVAVAFYILWLKEIIPASISGTIPESVAAAELPTNPVHVIDLSMFLPAICMLGIGLLKGKKMALYLTPVALVFFILMDLTIAALSSILMQRGQGSEEAVTIAMVMLALISLFILIWFLRTCNEDLSHSS